jgi:hypothetical protein
MISVMAMNDRHRSDIIFDPGPGSDKLQAKLECGTVSGES